MNQTLLIILSSILLAIVIFSIYKVHEINKQSIPIIPLTPAHHTKPPQTKKPTPPVHLSMNDNGARYA